jgi:nucleoside-diphosphate-sugar epimerase
MRVLIIGGAGMIGRKLAERLAQEGALGGRAISAMTLYDVSPPIAPAGATFKVETLTGDLPAPGETDKLVAAKPDVVFQLAAIVSGEAEQDFDKGYRINLVGMQNLLHSMRRAYDGTAKKPRLVFTSSIAVFGAPFPDKIGDEFFSTPLTSYGTQKAIGELLLADYTRKGMLDGIGIRLPTICVRPGKPNKAASGFFSNICREPLAGEEAVLPVGDDVLHWHASPRAAVGFLVHAATIDGAKVGPRRNLTMPGLAVTVGQQIEALRKVGGEKVVKRIRREPDLFIQRIVSGWPRNFDARRATELGFRAERSFEEILRIHIEDELRGKIT